MTQGSSVPNQTQGPSWVASEPRRHNHNISWYLAVVATATGLAIVAYFLSGGDPVPPVAIALVTTIFIGCATWSPGQQTCSIESIGLRVGSRLYAFNKFHSFSISRDDSGHRSLHLVFNQRFALPLTIPLPTDPDLGEQISRCLGDMVSYHPERQSHPIDRLMHYLRF